jgi:hypothetical protein
MPGISARHTRMFAPLEAEWEREGSGGGTGNGDEGTAARGVKTV